MKRLLLSYLLLLFSFISFSQTLEELDKKVIELINIEEYEKAIPFGEKAVEIAKKTLGENHLDYAYSLNNLAVLYGNMGQYEKAEPVYLEAIKIRKKVLGESHPSYANSLNNLAVLYGNMGQYEKAEPLYIQALGIRKKALGDNHPSYANSLNNLAGLYETMGQYEKAEPLNKELIEIQKKTLGESDPAYANSLNNLAVLYVNMGQYEKAEPLYIKAKDIRKKALGENHPSYANSLNNLATLYKFMGQYEKAESLYILAIDIRKNVLGESHPDYAFSLNDLAALYANMGQYEKAEPLYLESLKIRKKVLGETHSDYAFSLNNLAVLYTSMGQYEKAEPFYILAREIWRKALGANHPTYAFSIHNLAVLYANMGQYEKAEPLYQESINIRKKTLGESHPDYANSLNGLAALYKSMGQYEKAEPLYLLAKEIRQKVLGERHPDYATSLDNLAALYGSMGQYDKAESFYMLTIDLRKKVLGENHPDYGNSINNLAVLYASMGQYEKAEPLYLMAISIWKKVLGVNHPSYATSLNNLAKLYESMGEYEKAEPLYIQARDIRKKVLGESHPDYATSLNNLAVLYTSMGKYEKAESLHLMTKDLIKKILGEEHPDYATSLNNLAVLYTNMGQYKKAEPLYITARDIDKKILGESHPDYANSLNNLAVMYGSMGQYDKAESYMMMKNQIKIINLKKVFTSLSEKEKEKYLGHNIDLDNLNNSLLFQYPKASSSFYTACYNLQLLLKSLLLSDTKNWIEVIRKTTDLAIKQLFEKWQSNKTVLSKQYSLAKAAQRKDLKKLEDDTETLEKELNRKSSAFKKEMESFTVNTVDVWKNLLENEASVEFVRFYFYNKGWTDSVMYAAYVLKKNDSIPMFIPLCEERQLQQLFDSAGATATTMVNNFYRGLDLGKSGTDKFLGAKLYKLIWEPLEPYLKGIKKVSYSPAGKLFSIAFQALPVDSNSVLMDKYELQQYISTKQVALRNSEDQKQRPTNITLFGDAIFSMDSAQLTRQRTNQLTNGVSTFLYKPSTRGSNASLWPNLPGTAEEVKKIKQLFDTNKINTKEFVQTAASEGNLKALSGHSSQILHIATHGFFLPDPNQKRKETFGNENVYKLANDPLLRSGLILSGGNYAWSGKTPITGVEDGVVTAYEISQLNLSNTQLVVLSACETALGDVKGSEGVFGLQRAFKMAGVKKMILSLWQVPDKETAELMTSFYSYWVKGKSINDAFKQAQADMRKKYLPYFWAAFVLVE